MRPGHEAMGHLYRLKTGVPVVRIALAALALGSVFLVAASILDSRAIADLEALRNNLADEGGGVLFVRNPVDCLATAGTVEALAKMLTDRGVTVRGVIIRRGSRVDEALAAANETFPHRSISARATAPLYYMGHPRTPIALLVNASGTTVASIPIGDETRLRLADALEVLLEGLNL